MKQIMQSPEKQNFKRQELKEACWGGGEVEKRKKEKKNHSEFQYTNH